MLCYGVCGHLEHDRKLQISHSPMAIAIRARCHERYRFQGGQLRIYCIPTVFLWWTHIESALAWDLPLQVHMVIVGSIECGQSVLHTDR